MRRATTNKRQVTLLMLDQRKEKRDREVKKFTPRASISHERMPTHPFPEADNLYSVDPFVLTLIMCETKKDPSVVQIQPPLLFIGHQILADLQCLSSPRVKEPKRERIQVAFSRLGGSASFPDCMHERCPLSVVALHRLLRRSVGEMSGGKMRTKEGIIHSKLSLSLSFLPSHQRLPICCRKSPSIT